MPRRARIHYVSLRSSLVNLPISIYGPMLERNIRPQSLAIHLVSAAESSTKVEAFVGWTGMASASSLANFNASSSGDRGLETIEIDPQYAQGLGFTEGDIVEIGLLHDLKVATSVATEPLTSDDWEIIEIHASHVESTLLSQVRVAKVGQEIDVWVMGRTRVRLRVVSLDPPSKGNASLLATDTEVSIAPKLRNSQHGQPHKAKASSAVNDQDTKSQSEATEKPSQRPDAPTPARSLILRVLPSQLAGASFPPHSRQELLGYVTPSTFKRLQPSYPVIKDGRSVVLHPFSLECLPPPADPTAAISSSTEPAPVPAPRILKAGASEEKGSSDPQDNEVPLLHIGWMDGIPEGHIVLPTLAEGVEEWDLIRVSEASGASTVELDVTPSRNEREDGTTAESVLAGVDDILSKCKTFYKHQFLLHGSIPVVRGASGLLITGRSGAGKTTIAKETAKALQFDPLTPAYNLFVDMSRYTEQPVAKIKSLFQYWFEKASWHRPSILVLDNIDKLLGAEVEHADSFRARQLAELFRYIFSPNARTEAPNMKGIVLVATASSTATLHPLINGAHIFKEIVNVKPPNKDARKEILQRIVQQRLKSSIDITQDPDQPLNYAAIATQTEGYSALDLQDLVARAIHQVAIRATTSSKEKEALYLTYADFQTAQVDFVPLSLRDVKLQKSDTAWDDIGGLRETKRVLRETLEWPTKYGPIFAQSPLRLRSGLLLYGFPGCGKTLLASAVAKECGLNFISVKGPEILNKYIGASEKTVRDLFERASAAKPCVLFFDEFDSIAPKRGHDSTGVTDRVVNQMLTQMDGAEGLDGVYVLAATSRPDLIDSALLRPGRLDKSLFCNMPDLDERKDILQAIGRKIAFEENVDLDEVAAATEGFSGADLQALVYNAHLEVIHASISSTDLGASGGEKGNAEEKPIKFVAFGGKSGGNGKGVMTKAEEMALQRRLQQIRASRQTPTKAAKAERAAVEKKHITQDVLRQVLKTARPSVSVQERARLERIYKAFIDDRGGEGMPAPPEAGGIGSRATLA
ncbi:hypothetical protein AX16_010628 [Volvariella volvacea WC 439]|nr:hypothetical protein AX16_010628 [Volvariella volvacea WC 439]